MAGRKREGSRSADAGFETMSADDITAPAFSGQSDSGVATAGERSITKIGQTVLQAKRPSPSLKARAVAILSRREHSRHELKQKLAIYADESDDIDTLLDELVRENWQSDARFAQSLVNRRADRKGTQLILKELRQHGLTADALAQVSGELMDTELERARAVWRKKFGSLPADARDYAKQYRFLASRGFSSESVRRILGDRD